MPYPLNPDVEARIEARLDEYTSQLRPLTDTELDGIADVLAHIALHPATDER